MTTEARDGKIYEVGTLYTGDEGQERMTFERLVNLIGAEPAEDNKDYYSRMLELNLSCSDNDDIWYATPVTTRVEAIA